MQLLSLFRTNEKTQPPSRATAVSTALHAALLFGLLTTLHTGPQLTPYKLPGTTQGVTMLTYYSAGSPAHTVSDLSTKKPEAQSHTSTAHTLQAPSTPQTSQPTAETGSGSATQSGLGQGDINLALQKYFPYPKPDLSTLPHGFSGDVVLDATVDADGKISSLTLLKGLGPAIDNTVLATVKNWSYTPATRNGVPVPSEQELHFHYERS